MQAPVPQPTCWSCHASMARGVDHCSSCNALQPARWEYYVLTVNKKAGWSYHIDTDMVARFNALGAQGWELVSTAAQAGSFNATVSHSLIFKRRVI